VSPGRQDGLAPRHHFQTTRVSPGRQEAGATIFESDAMRAASAFARPCDPGGTLCSLTILAGSRPASVARAARGGERVRCLASCGCRASPPSAGAAAPRCQPLLLLIPPSPQQERNAPADTVLPLWPWRGAESRRLGLSLRPGGGAQLWALASALRTRAIISVDRATCELFYYSIVISRQGSSS
jgi:hypothetical protein